MTSQNCLGCACCQRTIDLEREMTTMQGQLALWMHSVDESRRRYTESVDELREIVPIIAEGCIEEARLRLALWILHSDESRRRVGRLTRELQRILVD